MEVSSRYLGQHLFFTGSLSWTATLALWLVIGQQPISLRFNSDVFHLEDRLDFSDNLRDVMTIN